MLIIVGRKQVIVGQGDTATEWEVEVNDREYTRRRQYNDITWKRVSAKDNKGKYPDDELKDRLESMFKEVRAHHIAP